MSKSIDLAFVNETVERIGGGAEKVLAILQALQGHYGYLPEEALRCVCELTDITPAAISGVSTFYDQFRHTPAGEHTIHVCVGTACHVKGAQGVYDAFKRFLNLSETQDTDAKGQFTVDKIACLGCCTLAPAVQIGDITFGHVSPDTVGTVLEEYLQAVEAAASQANKARGTHALDAGVQGEIRVGLGSCCIARGSGKLRKALDEVLIENGIHVTVKRVGCVGMCHQTPLLEVVLPNDKTFLYARVEPEDARGIVLRHFKGHGVARRLTHQVSRSVDRLFTDKPLSEPPDTRAIDLRDGPVLDFLGKQQHIATEHCGVIDPGDLAEYLSGGGFSALETCVKSLSPDQVIEQVEQSGLRGRGGAGFPTFRKWALVRANEGEQKYVVCNGDEGDPGPFMDRMLMESYPFRVIEGMAIAAYAVGATEGYFYIRAEYPLALERIKQAIAVCEEQGLLGEDIFGTDMTLRLHIMAGAGAFVCGEETALLASIEGKRGMPRLRPPYPAQSGLWECPTLINNVETYSAVSWILRHSAEEYAAVGTDTSKGTKVFALAGKIARGGLIEVPMGITISEIVHDIGGGIGGGRRLKAVQVGGPSGGCIPASLAHMPVDYETLIGAGAMMGSGGLVVLDDSDCMVDMAHYFLEFTQDQSCGKCTFCRVGTRRMLEILARLCQGQGKMQDLDALEQLASLIKQGSLCGLGMTAPNPVLSTLKHFRSEYEAHVAGRCPALKCQALITYHVTDDCIGCTLCAQHCPIENCI
ncbi:MAG: NAD(P)H-dependent oxidoreductase subunit E, partial [Phycisphaeraceae bacterium]|nr:NAD(P)H-dependent oxidoreductase subunit E [Phycisphaeraceae bacterium]